MIVIPAIDIKNGRCVRLKQGKMDQETIYSDAPHDMAKKWFDMGAERIHLVDLDGAIRGKPINRDAIKKIAGSVQAPIQLGGGIRDLATIEAYLDLGIHQVILGTVAYKDPEFVSLACKKFPGHIIIGIDALKGRVAIEGWTEETEISPNEMAKRFEHAGVSMIVYTDISRDGMQTGPNIPATKAIAQAVDIPVIASGGFSDIRDVENILPLSRFGVSGLITGRALYEGTLDLKEAIKILKSHGIPKHILTVKSSILNNIRVARDYFDTAGKDAKDTERIVREVDNVVNEIEYEAALEAKAISGIEKVLEFVRNKNLKQAIYTFNTYKNAKTSLAKVGMSHYFDVIVGRDHVKNAKPHPEHLTAICERLLVNPSNIIVIGDNHRDIEGALNVGAKSIALKTKLTKLTNSDILEKANKIVEEYEIPIKLIHAIEDLL